MKREVRSRKSNPARVSQPDSEFWWMWNEDEASAERLALFRRLMVQMRNKRSMKGIFGFILWLFLFQGGPFFARSAVWYVAPNGNDQWSGTRPTAAANRKDGPLASLSSALQIARRTKANEARTILLRGGTYELAAPITLAPADSGSDPQHPL